MMIVNNAGAALLISNCKIESMSPTEGADEMINDMKFLLRMALANEIPIEDLETIGVISRKWGLVENNNFDKLLSSTLSEKERK